MKHQPLRNIKNRALELMGVFDGEYAYKGPFHVQIDLTNDCNNRCIACWCNSPLLREKQLSMQEKQQRLPLALVKSLLDELSRLGTEEIYYSGSGEPFMYPYILEVLEYTKQHPFACFVNTNFTLMDKERLDFLIDKKVDWLTVSVWAGTAQTYRETHSPRTEGDFYRIKEHLIYLNRHKRTLPRVKLYHVIFNMNYFEIEQMITFAQETGCEAVEFTLVDTIPQATDCLALNKEQIGELQALSRAIHARLDGHGTIKNTSVSLLQFDQFLRRLSVQDDIEKARYDKNIIDSIPCYSGWLFSRIIPNGDVHPCLKAHRIPTGNLYGSSFSPIWNSTRQRQFRKKTLVYKKDDSFFHSIGNDPSMQETGCYKSCDDIGRNLLMHSRLKIVPAWQQHILSHSMRTWGCLRDWLSS